MSEETKLALDNAQTALNLANRGAHAAEARLLAAIAATLPANLEEIGKEVVQRDIDHARELGKERIAAMREELRVAAEQLGAHIRSSTDKVKWSDELFSSFVPSEFVIQDAIKSVFDRDSISKLISPLEEADFDVRAASYHANDFAPDSQHLDERKAVLTALHEVHYATGELAAAKAANDKSDAADLWA